MDYNRELDIGGAVLGTELVDVLDPLVVIVETVGRNTDDLDVTLCKVGSTASDLAELSSANRGEISGMREEDGLDVAVQIAAAEARKIIPKNHRSIRGS